MDFLNPLMGWGAFAVAIPIALHFWHQKKGKLLPWAATRWLSEKDLQPAKGIRLDNVLLLLIRCLLIFLFAFLLARPLLHQFSTDDTFRKIHLVQANSLVVNDFKFEIEEALKKGEEMYWMEEELPPLETTSVLPKESSLHPLKLQTYIHKAAEMNRSSVKVQFEIYLLNDPMLSQLSEVFIPGKAGIHSVVDTIQKPMKPYLELSNKHKVFVNSAGHLTVAPTLPINEKFASRAVHSGPVNVLMAYTDKSEKQSVKAALEALKEVFQLEFSVDEQPTAGKIYDWVFSDVSSVNLEKGMNAETMIFVPERKIPFSDNERFVNTRHYSPETVRNGQLPEWLGDVLINQFGLYPKRAPLSRQQLLSLFKTEQIPHHEATGEGWFSKALFFGLIILLSIERWLAIRKNA